MSKQLIAQFQTELKSMGLYGGAIDGIWGANSHRGFKALRDMKTRPPLPPTIAKYINAVAWSGKVSTRFVVITQNICSKLQLPNADELMSCMAFETGETFSPSIKNGAGAPYYGLIQFGKAAATDVGTTVEALVRMSAEEQLEYVYRFFKPYTGKLKNLGDIYMRILYPKAVGQPDSYVIFVNDGTKAYLQNKGLDANKDGKITRGECLIQINLKLIAGLNPVNLRAA